MPDGKSDSVALPFSVALFSNNWPDAEKINDIPFIGFVPELMNCNSVATGFTSEIDL